MIARAGIALVLSLTVAACAPEPTAVLGRLGSPARATTTERSATSTDCPACVVGPRTFTRLNGTPSTESISFAGDPAADYIIDIDDAGSQGADGSVELNGIVLLASRTNQDIGPRHVRQAVALREQNVLDVRLTGKPGSVLAVSILGGAKAIGVNGGTVTSHGHRTVLTIPEGALASATTLSIVETTTLVHGRTINGFQLLPDGQTFTKPVAVAIQRSSPIDQNESVYLVQGEWLQTWPTDVDETASRLTITTSHFSDWVYGVFPLLLGNYSIGFAPGATPHTFGPAATAPLTSSELFQEVKYAAAIWNPLTTAVGISLTPVESQNPDIVIEFVRDLTDTKGGEAWGLTAVGWPNVLRRRIQLDDRTEGLAPHWNSLDGFRVAPIESDQVSAQTLAKVLAHEIGHAVGVSHYKDVPCLDIETGWRWFDTKFNPNASQCLEPPLMAVRGDLPAPWALSRIEVLLLSAAYLAPGTPLIYHPAVQLSAVSTVAQNAAAGLPVSAPPTVKATDVNNNPVAGVPVLFMLGEPALGSVTQAVSVTGSDGLAKLGEWKLAAGSNAPQRVSAHAWLPSASNGIPEQRVLFSASPLASSQFSQQGPKLVGSGALGGAEQGHAVALSADGNTAIVGAPFLDNGFGAVLIWTRSGGVWAQQGPILVGSGALGNARQGSSVAISADGNTAIVGGHNDGGVGAAWVWIRSAGVWTQQGPKLPSEGAGEQGPRVSLSADGNTAIVGAPGGAAGGGAWVWTRNGGVWTKQGTKLVGSNASANSQQGFAVSLSGDGNTAIVGGFFDNNGTGAAWVWTRSGGIWTQQGAKLVGSGAAGAAQQGHSVSLSYDGNTAIIGGPFDPVGGAAWVWTRSGGVWTQQGAKLVGSGAVGQAQQGRSVSISADGSSAVVGGLEDSGRSGAAWVWTRSAGVWSQQGSKQIGSGAVGNALQGASVALSADGNTAIVGGPFDSSRVGAAWIFVR